MGVAGGIGIGDDIGHHDKGTGLDRRLDGTGIRHGNDGVGGHDPQRLDAAIGNRPEHIHRLEARLLRNRRRGPEALHPVAVFSVLDRHMGRQHIGKPAHLASAHGVGLAGQRKRPHARDRPMRPVARWQLMMALTLSVPLCDWLTP